MRKNQRNRNLGPVFQETLFYSSILPSGHSVLLCLKGAGSSIFMQTVFHGILIIMFLDYLISAVEALYPYRALAVDNLSARFSFRHFNFAVRLRSDLESAERFEPSYPPSFDDAALSVLGW